MAELTLTVGDFVVRSSTLGVIHKVGSLRGVDGYWIIDHTGDFGAAPSYPAHVPAWAVRPAIVGETVCHHTAGHGCGLLHLTRAGLIALGADPDQIVDHVWATPPHRKPVARATTIGDHL